MARKRTVVTGGAGFIGAHLVSQLVAAGHDVTVVDPQAEAGMFPDVVRIEKASILDQKLLQRSFSGAQWIFHLAGIAHLWSSDRKTYDRVNRQGTARVLAAAGDCGCEKLIVTSTEAILRDWRDHGDHTLTELEPSPPIEAMPGPYCRSKWQANHLIHKTARRSPGVISLYPTIPVGPGDRWKTAPAQMLETFLFNTPPVYLQTVLNLVPATDVASAHLLAAEKAEPGDRFILGGQDIKLSTLLEWLEMKTGQRMPKRHIPYVLAQAIGFFSEGIARITGKSPLATLEGVRLARHAWRVDSSHAQKVLGWHPGKARNAVLEAIDEMMPP
ncbi:MAG: NAD-dependent epimerase/dehydratase family protein [Pseudomonadota bacterium]